MLSSVTPSASVSTTSIAGQQQVYIPEKDEIWSGILKGVASTKMVPTKNVLILGEMGAGKSTLIHYLKNDPGPQQQREETPVNYHVKSHYTPHIKTPVEENDLALGYSFIDVKDEEHEAVARLGCYQLGLSSAEFLPLLKFAVRSQTVADSCVVILLDWSRPWKFLETLRSWIHVLRYVTDEICKENTTNQWSQGKAVMDELKENLEHYLQTYTEPSNGIVLTASTSTSSIVANPNPSTSTTTQALNTTNHTDQVVLPLTNGCLTTNFGIPIIVVCSKSDAMNNLEQTHDYKEDQFDYIQQTLRSICMKYGAALFYTSSYQPYTYHQLREYILHRLLTINGKPYPFQSRAQVVERDTVFVPSGWDSWNKIKVLREGFDCESISEGWDENMDADNSQTGAIGIYQEAIPNEESDSQPEHVSVATVCEDEQVFYERHFETLQKTVDSSRKVSRPGVVGPLGAPPTNDLTRIDTNKKESVEKTPNGSPPPTNNIDGQNGPSHEIIANFFQSLLSKKASGGSPTSSPTSILSGMQQSNGRSELDAYRRPTVSRKDVHKELDRMRQYTASSK
ncbi:hypothetical protein G6F57_011054 [Rhizopus arrhizus]|uniref:Dynein light intermediate chain n=1 Tax=Rhizopus oryzae TaxID=64495 RepID=A0A9P6X8G9_RHIOR|nr:hypothetical protein G6F23_010034 [Rhizopus arrhizus]KAG1410605.1 hypothetical protein G6F58_009032 [Rhizopus delemar]KAG0759157.1 hypothetical protein G6F24_009276 [Rhizopus arrhizus]KAG0791368.1 hypothetical protein G6F21_005139 [Rhizopus arrhizus]KAG0798177.1 hypothetical protein G6F22_004483 [Rhizopus arrhizus]